MVKYNILLSCNVGRIVKRVLLNVYTNPQHAYTKSLSSAIPLPDPREEKIETYCLCR